MAQYYLFCALLIVCGALAASALIIQKKPDAAELLAKIVPAQGVLGAVLGIWSLILLIQFLLNIGTAFSGGGKVVLFSLIFLLAILVGIGLGFILAYGLLDKYVLSKNAGAAEKAIAMRAKLVSVQIPLGVAGMALGVFFLILTVVR